MKRKRNICFSIILIFMVFVAGASSKITYLNFRQERLNLALVTSVMKGNSRDATAFLEQGANPNISVNNYKADTGSPNFSSALRHYFSPVSHDESRNPLLIEAIRRADNDTVIVAVLLHAGANINTQGKDGETPLSVAAEDNRVNILEMLLSQGAYVNVVDRHGWTPLMRAVCSSPYRGHPAIVQALLTKKADINARNENGETALILAAERKPDTVRLLIEYGADMNLEDREGHTALSVAKWAGASDIITLLEHKGAKE